VSEIDVTPDQTLVFGGLLTLDIAQLAERLPPVGEKGTAGAAYMDVGGPAANAAITASELGGAALLHTVVGSGDLAEYARRGLAGNDVALRDHAPAAEVPLASIWIEGPTGARTILATNNAHLRLQPTGPQLPDTTSAVLLDGHYPELAVAMAREAIERSVPIVLDCGRWRPVFSQLLPLATDVILCEAFRPPSISAATDEELVEAIAAEWEPHVCAITRGANDIITVIDGMAGRIAVPQVEVIDTTGAGDVLHGAYTHFRYGEQLSALDSLSTAADLASRSCTHLGVRRQPLS
jgi:sugar/nucleoside kinase (ribokinase family)